MKIISILLISVLCILTVASAQAYNTVHPAPVHIGHGLIGNQNPYETGAIILGSYFDPNQATYNNYGGSESRIFDYWRLTSSGLQWRPPSWRYFPAQYSANYYDLPGLYPYI